MNYAACWEYPSDITVEMVEIMDDIRIIQAGYEDIPRIAQVTAESWKAAYSGIIAEEYLASLKPDRWIDSLKRDLNKSMKVLKVVKNEEVIGISGYGKSRHENYKYDGEIVSMYFLPTCFGKGYGHLLMKRVLAELSNLGYSSVVLTTLAANTRACSFYTKWGFSVVDAGILPDLGGIAYEYQLLRRYLP